MARPREFDEDAVLDVAIGCFWKRGYQATSIRDLIDETGITGASLYNAFGDKRALFGRVFDRYVEETVAARIRRCERLPPREAISTFFAEVLKRSLTDREHKGCMIVNSALDVAPHDPDFRITISAVLVRIEQFFLAHVREGQADGTIGRAVSAENLARQLLGALMGLRVLARVRPERALLEGIVTTALRALDANGCDK